MKPKLEKVTSALASWAVIALIATPAARAQNAKLNLSFLSTLADRADEVVDVTLDGPTLKFAEKFMEADEDEKDDAELFQLIKSLKGIYVKSFEFSKPSEYSEADVEAIRSQLRGSAWTRFVNVQSRRDRERDEIYLMPDSSGKGSLGLAILVAEPQELTVINIVGPIDVEHLGQLEGKMGVPNLDLKSGKHGGGHEAH
jgi:hypothetical protein